MIYVLEGNEAVFKTTIANKLSELTGYPVIKGSSFELSQKHNDELNFYFKSLLDLDDIIIDRFIYSNLVYADLYKDYSILTYEQVEVLEETMRKKSVKTVYLYADSEAIKERLRVRGDDYVEENMVDTINEKFNEVISDAKARITCYDTEIFTSDEISKELAEYVK